MNKEKNAFGGVVKNMETLSNNIESTLDKAIYGLKLKNKQIKQLKSDKKELIDAFYELNSIPPINCKKLLICWSNIFKMIDRVKSNE